MQRDFHIWGRHPVEAFLNKLKKEGEFERKAYTLHVIVDPSGKLPSQLVEPTRAAELLGLRVFKYRNEKEENWPLNPEDQLNHQRICLKIPKFPLADLEAAKKICKDADKSKFKGCIGVVLDQVQDPRNFGAILRSAAFFGAKFAIFGKNRQAEISPLVLKTSAGGAFSLELIEVVNISRALAELKEAGAWVAGTAVQNSTPMRSVPIDRPFVLVLGNEEKGQRPEVSKQCDYLVSIPGGNDSVDSLNVSVAGGVLLSYFAQG